MKHCEMGGLNMPLRPMDGLIGSVRARRTAGGTPEAPASKVCDSVGTRRGGRASLGIIAMGLGWLACTPAGSYPLFGVLDGVKNVVVTGCDPKVRDWLEANTQWCSEKIQITTVTPEEAAQKPTLMEDQNTHLLFLIDRSLSESKFPEQWSHLFAGHRVRGRDLPDPATLGPYDIMAAAIRRVPGGGFCYNIVVSAPDYKTLLTELGALVQADIGGGGLPGGRGKLRPPLDDYSHVVSTEPVTVIHNLSDLKAKELMSSLKGTNEYPLSYKGLQAAASDVSALDASSEVYLIARKDAEIPEALRSRLPDDLSKRKDIDQVAVRKEKPGGQKLDCVLLAYWTEEHLSRAVLGEYRTLESVPTTPRVSSLIDLRQYGRVAVAPVRSTGVREGESLAPQVTNEIVNGFKKLGLAVEPQADLTQVLADKALQMEGMVAREVVDGVRAMVQSDALLVADLVSCSQRTTFSSDWSQETTIPSELGRDTDRPEKPNLYCGKYRDRNDPKYLKDMEDWEVANRKWEDLQDRRRDYRVDWQETVTASSIVECAVQCRLIGLREGPDYGKVIWSGTVKGEGTDAQRSRGGSVATRGVDATKPSSRARKAEQEAPPSVLTAAAQSAGEALCRDIETQVVFRERTREEDPGRPPDGAQVANIDGNDVWLTLGAKCSAVEGDTFLIEVGKTQIPGLDGKPIHEEPITIEAVVQQTYAAEEGKPPVAKCSPSVASDMIQVKQGQLATLRKGATQPPPLPPPPPVPPDGAAVDAVDENSVWLILGRDCAADIGDRFNVEVEGRQVTVTVQNVGKPGAEGNRRAQCAVLDPQERGLLRSGLPASLLPRIPLPPEKILVTVTVLLEEVRGQTPMAQKPKVGTVEQLDALQRAITGAQQEACKQIKERLKVTVSVEQVKGISKATGKHGWNPQTKTYNAIIRVEGTVEGEKTAEGESQ